jgi:hypothetical protein
MSDWRIGTSPAGLTIVVRGDECGNDYEIVAKPYCIDGRSATDIARLIVAAPEMLAVLHRADPEVWGDSDTVRKWLADANAAIAKAEGRVERWTN